MINRAPGGRCVRVDETGARIGLTAMKFDPVVRAVAVIRFSPGLITVLEKMFLECCSFDRMREPPGLSPWTGGFPPAAGTAFLT